MPAGSAWASLMAVGAFGDPVAVGSFCSLLDLIGGAFDSSGIVVPLSSCMVVLLLCWTLGAVPYCFSMTITILNVAYPTGDVKRKYIIITYGCVV
jgi:hypothetical protein